MYKIRRWFILSAIGFVAAAISIAVMNTLFNQATILQAIVIGLGVGLGLVIIRSVGRSVVRSG